MTAPSSLPATWGTVGGTSITGYTNAATWGLVFVTLSGPYIRNPPPGYPIPPYPGNVESSLTALPQTIASGTRLQLFADEAAALVSAGNASYS
jgi:hypothetical protein